MSDTDEDKVVYVMRHPECYSNVGGTNDDDNTRLTPKGERQVPGIIRFIHRKKIQFIITSMALRTLEVMIKDRAGLPMVSSPLFGEWPRADWVRGKKWDEPFVSDIKDRRLAEFGPDFVPLSGEQSWDEKIKSLEAGFRFLQALEQRRVLILGHRYTSLMQKVRVLVGSFDPVLFPFVFRMLDKTSMFENTDYFEFVYTNLYRSEQMGWRCRDGKQIETVE